MKRPIEELITYIKEAWIHNPFPDIILGVIGKGVLDYSLHQVKDIDNPKNYITISDTTKIINNPCSSFYIACDQLLNPSRLTDLTSLIAEYISLAIIDKIRVVPGTMRMFVTEKDSVIVFKLVYLGEKINTERQSSASE